MKEGKRKTLSNINTRASSESNNGEGTLVIVKNHKHHSNTHLLFRKRI